MASLDLVVGIVIGLAAATALFGGATWILGKLRSAGGRPKGTGPAPPSVWAQAPPLIDPVAPVETVPGPGPDVGDPEDPPDRPAGPSSPALPIGNPPGPPSTVSRSVPVAEATVQWSHRVVLHLFAQGIYRPDDVAPKALSQAGIIEALQIRQGALAAVLRRLEAAQVVRSETAHVQGGRRRVKVYHLTDRGWQLARDLRPKPSSPARRRPPG